MSDVVTQNVPTAIVVVLFLFLFCEPHRHKKKIGFREKMKP